MHYVGRKASILKYFLYYIMHLADLLALMRTQVNAQGLCKLRIDLLQGLPSLFLFILFLEIPTCFLQYCCSDSWFDGCKVASYLPVALKMLASAFMMLFIFLMLSTIF